MRTVDEQITPNQITLRGQFPDVIEYLKKEQDRCGKIYISQYIKKKQAEKLYNKQLIFPSYKGEL